MRDRHPDHWTVMFDHETGGRGVLRPGEYRAKGLSHEPGVFEMTDLVPVAERDRLRAEKEALYAEMTGLRAENERRAKQHDAEREILYGLCRRLGVPLMSPPRAPEALDALGHEVERLREELGYRPTAENGYCVACGCYMPQSLDGTKRVHGCNRTPPLGNLPTTIYACPTCGGHASFAAGCWGTQERPHEHIFMRPVHEIVAELARASDETLAPGAEEA